MGFLKRLFGGKQKPYEDKQGIYLYVVCDHCDSRLRVRVDKQYDLNRTGQGYRWRKSLVDSKCFLPMETVVTFDRSYEVVEAEIEGGRYVSQSEYEALAVAEKKRQEALAAEETEDRQHGDEAV